MCLLQTHSKLILMFIKVFKVCTVYTIKRKLCCCVRLLLSVLYSFSWKILCVLTRFRTKMSWKIGSVLMLFFPHGKSCSCNILRIISPRKFDVFYKGIMSSPVKFISFLITSKPPGKFDVL